MAKKILTTHLELQKWADTFPFDTQFEGAPSPSKTGGGGRIAQDLFRRVRRDFSDVPIAERWLIQAIGYPKSNVAVLLTEAVDVQILTKDQRPDSYEATMRLRLALLSERESFVNEMQKMTRNHMSIIEQRTGIEKATTSNLKEVVELVKLLNDERAGFIDAHRDLSEQVIDEKERNELLRQGGYTANRLIDLLAMWRLKSADGRFADPAIQERYERVQAEERADQARPSEFKEARESLFQEILDMQASDVSDLVKIVKSFKGQKNGQGKRAEQGSEASPNPSSSRQSARPWRDRYKNRRTTDGGQRQESPPSKADDPASD